MNILNNRLIIFIAKIVVVAVSFSFILYKFFTYENIIDIFMSFRYFGQDEFILLSIVGFLVFVNWFIEAIKWRKLVLPIEKINLLTSYKAVFSGITVSMFTPNRTGEFLGRILVLSSNKRIDGVAATVIGSFSQFIITVLVGIVGSAYLFFSGKILPDISFSWELIIGVFCVLVILALLVYFNLRKILQYFLHFPLFERIEKYFRFTSQYEKEDLLQVMFLSFLRYMVFVLQFYLLFQSFQIEIEFINCFAGVGIMYFIMAAIPTFTIAELGVRGSVALLVFEIFTANVTGIVATSLVLWIFNLAVPALIGAVLFSKMKI